MPRNVRNFWLQARVDGRESAVEGGPTSRDGEMHGVIMQRHDGSIADARLHIDCETVGPTLRTFVSIDSNVVPLPDGVRFALIRRDGERIELMPGDAILLETTR